MVFLSLREIFRRNIGGSFGIWVLNRAGTTEGRAVRPGVDSVLELPRWAVEDGDGEEFLRKLSTTPLSM